jgi:hypothetical protein
MRFTFFAVVATVVSTVAAAPSLAQGGPFVWCTATATNGPDTTVYYSGVFPGDRAAATAKAAEFKAEAEGAEVSAASVSARCYSAAGHAEATAARDAAMRQQPGELLDWAG